MALYILQLKGLPKTAQATIGRQTNLLKKQNIWQTNLAYVEKNSASALDKITGPK
mgnify:CR=1 FL=1